jgi:hypothetical protein
MSHHNVKNHQIIGILCHTFICDRKIVYAMSICSYILTSFAVAQNQCDTKICVRLRRNKEVVNWLFSPRAGPKGVRHVRPHRAPNFWGPKKI